MVVINEKSYWFDALKELNINIIGINKGSSIYNNIIWGDEVNKPTEAEIDAEIVKIQAEYDSLEYARGRETEYPTIEELTISLFDTDDKAALETKRAAVKAKWPKDNSGGKYGLGEDGSPIEPEMFP